MRAGNRMPTASTSRLHRFPPSRPLRLGFLALNDAAPLIVAQEHGLFRKFGLRVELSREIGWATVRDKIIYGELDGAHALGGMVISTTLGLNCPPCPCLTACVLTLNGDAITLSEKLWKRDIRDAHGFREELLRARNSHVYVFGVVYPHSAQRIHLNDWLRPAGIDPDRDVRVVVVPPSQLCRNLAAGTIDGFCAGDPWNSLAVSEQTGWIVATGAELNPGHPEKVFMVRSSFAESRHEEHLALVAALTESAALCETPEFRADLPKLLSRREYLNVSSATIRLGLAGPFHRGHGQTTATDDFIVFHRDRANDPTPARGAWLIERLKRHELIPSSVHVPSDLVRRTFRTDLFHQAINRHGEQRRADSL